MTLLLSLLAACGPMASTFSAPQANGAQVFKLREVSSFEQGDRGFLRGQSANCEEKPSAAVKSYPAFVSRKPIFGSVRFAADYGQTNGGMLFYFALDESQGTGKGYDRLYFDRNRDLDLRNDPVLKPQQEPPPNALRTFQGIKQQVAFDLLSIDFDFGSAGTRPVEIMPRLTISAYEKEEYRDVTFVRTRQRLGDIKLGSARYQARLGNDYLIRGRLDHPGTALLLTPKDGSPSMYWWGGDRLMAAHKLRGNFYTFSATPTGDELTVHRYRGDLGTFEIGSGGRSISNLTVSGSLTGKDRAVPVGGQFTDSSSMEPARSCQLPVGDYMPTHLTVQFGRLGIALSDNYHSEGKPRDRLGRPHVYGFAIRKDHPCVLDFSNKPDVMFASPARDRAFKPGDTVEVKAVLVDPKLDFMIRGLDDTTRKKTDAKGSTYERNLSLDPKVTVTRANGQKVAEGVMPFG